MPKKEQNQTTDCIKSLFKHYIGKIIQLSVINFLTIPQHLCLLC